MKKINNFQSWLFKPVVSAIVFLSLIVIGGVAIIARNSNPSSLPSLKSGANSQKLTAQNWDALVDYVAGMDADVQSKLGDINQKIIQISGSIINNNGNGTPTTNTGGIWDKNGSNIYYNAGNVGIGINNPTAKLQVNGNVIASNPTANNHVATKEYVDNHKPTIKDYVLIQIKVGISKQNVATDNYDTCFVTGIMDGG
ncbi:MAG: hypothetical protein LBD11_06315 [Candidatus Peribacteria bacterium]|jgi:hypothetical protein|nr:hypothetical protein [Candidatus Peribacteria bacterium]